MAQRLFYFFLIAVIILATTSTLFAQGERGRPVLQPKAGLPTEPAAWSQAPLVPPPIARKDQRRVVVNWTITETKGQIAPGVIYDDYWAIEGKVPGPVLRVREGDLVEVHLTNHVTSMRNHNIDFHFVTGPGGGASALNVAPGETAVLEVRAMAAGFYMFHCASPDIPTHIANGMYGYVIVDPAEGMTPADREYYVVQSEIYTKDGAKGHQNFDIARGEREDAQYMVFNGAVGALMGANALKADVGQTVRLWVGNPGPNLISSFHVIGQIFSNVYREGDLISPPAHNIQTTLVPAGGSTVVEFSSAVPGMFLLVDHAIFRLHKGLVGAINIGGGKNPEVFDPVTASQAKANDMSDHAHAEPPAPAPAATPKALPAKPTSKSTKPVTTTSLSQRPELKLVALTGPVIAITGDSFPKPSAEEEAGPVQSGTVVIRVLEGAGNYDTDPTNDFSAPKITVAVGTAVKFLNTDSIVHINKDDKGEFQTPQLKTGESYAHIFKKPGVYHYTCIPHPWMKGTIIVR